MALLGRAGAAAVEILETGAVLVGRLCENSVKKGTGYVYCARVELSSIVLVFSSQCYSFSINFSPFLCGQCRMRVCVHVW